MKIKFILFPCLIGLLALASCNSNTKETTKTTKEDETTTTSVEPTTEVPTTTSIETSTDIETTTEETSTSGVSNGGSYEDDDEWGELHT